ncbi:MAG TPA: amino acid synthesis family protein [Burkholderiales bacterium]|nr:amino acid synthesis family protein [Burkholderiales bacterium]
MSYRIRGWLTFSEEILANETGRAADGEPVRKFAVVCVLENPYAGRFSEDLSLLVKPSPELGRQFGQRLTALSRNLKIQSYGKACIVGVDGEYEHGNALLTTAFADPVRDAVGGGKAWIASSGKRGGPGTTIDVPLAHKDALYVRSHYDTMSVTLHDAPMPREIAVIFCAATRGRLHARLGGLDADAIKGQDGLR